MVLSARRRLSRVAAVMMAVPGMVAAAGPTAAAEAGGALAVSVTASMPRFPCFLQSGVCTAALGGGVTGQLGGSSWSATLDGAALEGSLHYVHGIDCLSGGGSGTFLVTATEDAGLVSGWASSSPGSAAHGIRGVRLRGDFTMAQSGLQAELVVANVSVALDVAGRGWAEVSSGGLGAGATTYVPSADALDPERCAWVLGGPSAPAEVQLTGALAMRVR